ncbi:winged helix-turn-helix domain-containing protein [Halorientalis brevis]|uniref:Winged helix-turn-helix domain-containing protein n=1 Tax=Halorientalis brevis TaxID=1126241 RepID=A0ABD6CH27_9EURY|nr:winged helix-turn-helix domain-containing protein [Halorientalis brevis]
MSEVESTEAYADDTPLVELFGENARTRILAAIVGNRKRELSVSELAREAGVARKTVYDHIDELVEIDAVEAREGGQGNRYTLADTELGELLYKTEGIALRNLLEAENKL